MKALTSLIVTVSLVAGGTIVWKTCGTAFAQPTPASPATVVALPASKPAPLVTESPKDAEKDAVVAVKPVEGETAPTETPEASAPVVAAPIVLKDEGKGATSKLDLVYQDTDLITAVQQGVIQSVLKGNGRDKMSAQLRNNSASAFRVHIPAGQVLESGRNAVVVLRAQTVEMIPGQSMELALSTAGLHSANKLGETTYKLSYQSSAKLDGFLQWLDSHPEIAQSTAQVAVLALAENLPLNAVAKFAPVNGVKSRFNTDAFRVDTADIVCALAALRECGVRPETLALSVDPQLKIEAMIEPLSREMAKRYFGIAEEKEWDFWKNELLNGDPSTRHYALFGIARFYPEIAMDMLPRWVRESKTHPVYRMSAIQALADTQRPDALPLLRQLADELGADTELGKAATQAAGYLDSRLTQLASALPVVFRPIMEYAMGL